MGAADEEDGRLGFVEMGVVGDFDDFDGVVLEGSKETLLRYRQISFFKRIVP